MEGNKFNVNINELNCLPNNTATWGGVGGTKSKKLCMLLDQGKRYCKPILNSYYIFAFHSGMV